MYIHIYWLKNIYNNYLVENDKKLWEMDDKILNKRITWN